MSTNYSLLFTIWNYKQLKLRKRPSNEKEPKIISISYEPRFMFKFEDKAEKPML